MPADLQKTLQEWSALQSVWGVPERQKVAGSSLELVEIKREKAPDGHTIIYYNFKVKGLPANATYTMEYWPVGSPVHPFQKIASGLKINSEGFVVRLPNMPCGDKNRPEYPLQIAIQKTAGGDTHRFILSSEKDRNAWVTGIATPFPNRSVSDSCQLEIVRMSHNGEVLFLYGSGFPKDQTLTFQDNSAGEERAATTHTNDQGHFQMVELPFVTGKNSGKLEIKVASGADCHPAISAEWGEGSYQPQ